MDYHHSISPNLTSVDVGLATEEDLKAQGIVQFHLFCKAHCKEAPTGLEFACGIKLTKEHPIIV